MKYLIIIKATFIVTYRIFFSYYTKMFYDSRRAVWRLGNKRSCVTASVLNSAEIYLLPNYTLGTRYKFRVAAENRHGISPESQAVTTRMLEEGEKYRLVHNKMLKNI